MADGRVGGQLVLIGAPLTAPGAGSRRLRAALAGADIIVTGDRAALERAAADLDVALGGRVIGSGGGAALVAEVIAEARQGASVALVAGAWLGSGPRDGSDGAGLVAAAHEAGIPVTVVPGPDPVTAALAVSGFPAERFRVEAGLPLAAAARRSRLAQLATEPRTIVVREAAHRLPDTLASLREVLGAERAAVLCVHPTTAGGQVRRGSLAGLAGRAAPGAGVADPPPAPGTLPGGEVVLVIAGAPPVASQALDPATLRAAVAARVASGQSRRDAVEAVAQEHGIRRRDVYQTTLDV